MKNFVFILCITFIFSCDLVDKRENFTAEGLKPIYANDWKEITLEPARDIGQLGKIYYHQGWLFVNELYKGIHIIDNTQPENPIRKAFISIPGNVDIAAKGDVIFADNYSDMLSIRIPTGEQVEVLSRISNLYPKAIEDYPPEYSGYFECVDVTKGIVIGWEEATLSNPECKR
jgi:hypothetical protein